MRDEPMTVFIVNHNGMSLEAFGQERPPLETGAISSRRISRNVDHGRPASSVKHGRHPGWTDFSVDLATGEVRFDDAAASPKSVE